MDGIVLYDDSRLGSFRRHAERDWWSFAAESSRLTASTYSYESGETFVLCDCRAKCVILGKANRMPEAASYWKTLAIRDSLIHGAKSLRLTMERELPW
jgi:hypothetical protein